MSEQNIEDVYQLAQQLVNNCVRQKQSFMRSIRQKSEVRWA